ncbi:MAG: FAD-binding protein, partial [Pseudomonadota bacterium]
MLAPQTESELASVVAEASDPLRIMGGGTRPVGQASGQVLSVAGLSGVSLYEPGALTIVAGAGTPLSEVEGALSEAGQQLPFEPMDHRALLGIDGVPTIGGVVAANASGPRRVQAGACRDSLIGVRFVDGRGDVIKNGGRVMKNVTGYDLVKLLAGSWGTLGVLSEVAFKVLPRPEAAATLQVHGLSEADAVGILCKALASPFEVSGAAHVSTGQGGPVTLLRVEGFAEQVSYRCGRLKDLLAETCANISTETDPERVRDQWKDVRDAAPLAGPDGDIWRFSVKPTDAPGLVETLRGICPDLEAMFDWGGGLVWVRAKEGSDLRFGGLKGHATLVRAAAETKTRLGVFHPEPAPVA